MLGIVMPVERKYERDVDLLLAEEFTLNDTFAERFKALTKFADKRARVADFWVSKSNSLGESDLIILYQSEDGERFALLIEDKVDAPLQPEQAERYRQRAERERSVGTYGDYEVVLCAPHHYISNRSDLGGFDHLFSFEQLAELIRSSNDPRSDYRASFLESAGTKRINTWAREDDPATNEFWDAAYELATREFPQLEMKRLRVTKGSPWITFRPRDLPTRPKHVYVILKSDRGQIDLTFSNTTAYRFQPSIAHLLDSDMTVHQTRASAAIRIEREKFLIADGFMVGLPNVRAAFDASSRLIALYRRARMELDQAANAATPT
jgi:hypothetical protein